MGRISSAVEIPHRRRHSPDHHDPYRRRRSPDHQDRSRRRRSPDYHSLSRRSPSRSPSPANRRNLRPSPDYSTNPRPESKRRYNDYEDRNNNSNSNRAAPPYLDRDFKSGPPPETESDEELKGLSYEEHRRVKRQKLRKRFTVNSFVWNVTPSPPRGEDEPYEQEPEEIAVKYSDSSDKEKERAESEDNSSSASDSSRSRKKKKRSRSSRSKRRSKKLDSETDSELEESGDDSEEDRKRRKKSKSKRSRHSKRTRRSSGKKKRKNRYSSDSSDSESESKESSDDDQVKTKKKAKKNGDGGSHLVSGESSGHEIDEKSLVHIEDETKAAEVNDEEALMLKQMIESRKKVALEDEDVVGPMPLPRAEGHISYGGALRPGEGDAIAQYVQQGKRIPRRGEVGLSADEISKFEDLGYVMSGSRHQRMNAIRIRKENQVYSAEDKRALAMFNYEEKAKREQKVMSDLQRLVHRHIGEETGPSHDPFGGGEDGDA